MAATLQHLNVVFAAVAVTACRTEARPATDTGTESGGPSGAGAQCWVAESALLRPEDRTDAAESTWLRLDSIARIVQSDGASLDGTWQRLPGDSLAVRAFDDLVRLEIRMRFPTAPLSRLLLRDLTKDGRPDSLQLIAIGQRPESLRVTFSVTSGGETRYQASWSEWYFIYDRLIDSIPAAERSKRVGDHLNEFFLPQDFGTVSPDDSSDAFDILPYEVCGQPAGTPVAEGRESCPAGLVRSILQDIVALSPPTFRFFSGGEHSRIIAWSRQLRRFVVIFACC